MFVLVYGPAAKANLHRAQCACRGRIDWSRYRVPAPDSLPATVSTLVEALNAHEVTRARRNGYRVVVSKCARRD